MHGLALYHNYINIFVSVLYKATDAWAIQNFCSRQHIFKSRKVKILNEGRSKIILNLKTLCHGEVWGALEKSRPRELGLFFQYSKDCQQEEELE